MMGGLTVTTPEQVRIYTEITKDTVVLGQHIKEGPCLPEHHQQWRAAVADGRDCPRVDLHQDDVLPNELLHIQASEHTRGLFPMKFQAAVGHLPIDEQEAILDRVVAGLMCQAVVDKLFPKVEPPHKVTHGKQG